jgi:hypothetical protein
MAEVIHNQQELDLDPNTFLDALFRFACGPRRRPLLAKYVPGLVEQTRLPKSPKEFEPDKVVGMFAELPCENAKVAITVGASVLFGDTLANLDGIAVAQRVAGYGYVPPAVYPASFNVLFVYPKDTQQITEETAATFGIEASFEGRARVVVKAPPDFLTEGHPVRDEMLAMGIREEDLPFSAEGAIAFPEETADRILQATTPFINNILADYSLS